MSRRNVYIFQSVYYTVTGIWPLVSIDSFMAVTGPKTDVWLVKMVGSLVLVNGLTLAWMAFEDRSDDALPLFFAASNTLAFTAIDVAYTRRRRIRPVYFGDAIVQLAVLAALALTR
ncbi:MAG: hypothetical protein JO060_09815 [Candidatus Eremiobacteraeota bacterium]|nr:hypothetical protein [Candidatus Eremiobacteraeota bacterium]MBV9646253.1 hypothetical protein [Candidatus Eremiobacteraeota bacterium]